MAASKWRVVVNMCQLVKGGACRGAKESQGEALQQNTQSLQEAQEAQGFKKFGVKKLGVKKLGFKKLGVKGQQRQPLQVRSGSSGSRCK